MNPIYVGRAGWSIGRRYAESFPGDGSHLDRYAKRFPAAEINSSFYRAHQPDTYARWANSVPNSFRFSVKAPKEITHTRKLRDTREPMEGFIQQVLALGVKLGAVLVQLPPSLVYDEGLAEAFFGELRQCYTGGIALEPRNESVV